MNGDRLGGWPKPKKDDPPLEVFPVGEVNGRGEMSEGNDVPETVLTLHINVETPSRNDDLLKSC
jgi:hypothetical protein